MSEFSDLQSALESVAADRAERLLRIRRGELISVTALEPLVIARAYGVRDLLLNGAIRHSGRLAVTHGDLNAALVFATLTATMRRMLTSISRNGPPAVRAAKANARPDIVAGGNNVGSARLVGLDRGALLLDQAGDHPRSPALEQAPADPHTTFRA